MKKRAVCWEGGTRWQLVTEEVTGWLQQLLVIFEKILQ